MKKSFLFLILLLSLLFLFSACGEEESAAPAEEVKEIEEIVPEETEPLPEVQEAEPAVFEVPYPDTIPEISYSQPTEYDALFTLQSDFLTDANQAEVILGQEKISNFDNAGSEFSLRYGPSITSDEESWSALSSKSCSYHDYIYTLSGSQLLVLSFQNGYAEKINVIPASEDPMDGWYGNDTPFAMTVSGDSLYLLSKESLFRNTESEFENEEDSYNAVHIRTFSLADPENPELVNDYALRGIIIGSCYNQEGILFAAYAPIEDPSYSMSESYAPSIVCNGEERLFALSEILMPSQMRSSGYTLLGFLPFDSSEAKFRAIAGYFPYGILSGENLFLAGSGKILQKSEAYEESRYSVVACSYKSFAEVISLNADDFSLTANRLFPGGISNGSDFALVDGNPILALIGKNTLFRTFSDREYGFENTLKDSEEENAQVIRFDENLQVRGAFDSKDICEIEISAGRAWLFQKNGGFYPERYLNLSAEKLKAENCALLTYLPIQVLEKNEFGILCCCLSYEPDGDYYDYTLDYLMPDSLDRIASLNDISGDLLIPCRESGEILLRQAGTSSIYKYGEGYFEYAGDISISYLDAEDTALFRTESVLCLCNSSAFYTFNEDYSIDETIPFALG